MEFSFDETPSPLPQPSISIHTHFIFHPNSPFSRIFPTTPSDFCRSLTAKIRTRSGKDPKKVRRRSDRTAYLNKIWIKFFRKMLSYFGSCWWQYPLTFLVICLQRVPFLVVPLHWTDLLLAPWASPALMPKPLLEPELTKPL